MLPDVNELLQSIKKAALDAVEASKPVNVYFGEVISASPLLVNVEQKMVLGKAQLVLTRNVTDFKTMVTVQWESEKEEQTHTHNVEGTDCQSEKHTHEIVGQKEITIHNALEIGDTVILVRQQKGQKYVILDRIGVTV